MSPKRISISLDQIAPFSREFFGTKEIITAIGSDSIGGKASGLAFASNVLAGAEVSEPGGIEVTVPRLVVIATSFFDRFMERNGLHDVALSGEPDDRIAHAFQKASLPAEMVGDLRGLIAAVHSPLAVRSSSLLEDALYEPFAGVYGTKMIPNNEPETDKRFHKLVEAVKYVYASAFFAGAKDYIGMTNRSIEEEKMAVVIQEVVGRRHQDRFYPHISGVLRSHNFYPMGSAKPEEGIVDLALGLGKTIVDGGVAWSYSPARPRAGPPVGSAGELLERTQNTFWAVNMGKPPEHDPIRETEYLVRGNLIDADRDGTLRFLASTYRPQDDRIVPGVGSPGPRVLDFAPILVSGGVPLNDLLRRLLKLFEEAVECAVEIEFAVTLDPRRGLPARLGFLQVRPMVVQQGVVDIDPGEMSAPGALCASERALGNGVDRTIEDVVYVVPDSFDASETQAIASELAAINRGLVEQKRPYLLIGFGRWGSSDPWLGIPVEWGQISGARVIVEATLPGMNIELSQGSHFFHNLTSFKVLYFCVHHAGKHPIRWDRLEAGEKVFETERVRHVRLASPLTIKVDGRSGRGVILA